MPRPRYARKPDDALYQPELAARLGITVRTLSAWRSRGRPAGNPVPDPDGWEVTGGNARPWWHEATADAWEARRPTGKR